LYLSKFLPKKQTIFTETTRSNTMNFKHLLLTLVIGFSGLSLMAQNTTEEVKDYAAYPYWQDMMLDESVSFYETQKAFYEYWENRTPTRGTGFKVFKRWEYQWETLVSPEGKFPKAGKVYNEYMRYQEENPISGRMKSGAPIWVERGPKTRVNYGGYNGVGRINAIAFHPTDPETIYVGAPSGGFWYTHNGGSTWATSTDTLPTLGVSAIIVHPDNPDDILIGTGDDDGGSDPGLGVFRSADGGLTWSESSEGMGNKTVGVFAKSEADHNLILAGTKNTGIYKSTDFGVSWTKTNAPDKNFRNLEYKPGDDQVVYATESGFWRSEDGGDNWDKIGSDEGLTKSGRFVMTVTPANPELVYVLVGSSAFEGVFKSTDSGLTFTLMADSPNILGYAKDGSDDRSQAGYDLILYADPRSENTVHAGGINLWKTTDGGTNWTITGHWYGAEGVNEVHADQHEFAWNPVNNRLYNGNDGGVYWTDNNGVSWTEISEGLGIGQMYKIGVSATNPDKVMTGFQDNGTATLMGSNWLSTGGGDGMECLVDHFDDAWSYSTLYYGSITRRYNNGSSKNVAGEGSNGIDEAGAWVTPFCLAENDPNTMILGMKNLWIADNIRDNGTINWVKATTDIGGSKGRVIEHSPSDFDVLYYVQANNKIWRTDNLFDKPSFAEITSSLPGGTVRDLECHPYDSYTVYMTSGTKVYKSINKGTSWEDISGSLPDVAMKDIVYDKTSNEGLYVASMTGVYYKDADMEDWVQYGLGLPVSVEATEVEIYYDRIDRADSKLRVGTYGRGLWEIELAPTTSLLPPGMLEGVAETSMVELEWQAPFYPQTISEYNVYRNDTLLATVSGTSYLDRDVVNELTYEYYVTASYIGAGESIASNLVSVTPLGDIALPYSQDFEKGNAGWKAAYTFDGWQYGNADELKVTGNTGSFFGINSGMAGAGIHVMDYLRTPKIDLSPYYGKTVTLKFRYTLRLYMDYDKLYIVWKTGAGERWNIHEEIRKPSGFGWPWTEKEIELPQDALAADAQIGFLYDDNEEHGWGAGIDDVQVFVNTSSIFDLELASSLSVYPNPSEGKFEIRLKDLKPGSVKIDISDITGKTIYSKKYSNGALEITEHVDLSNYSKGIYSLKVQNGESVYTTKLTIN